MSGDAAITGGEASDVTAAELALGLLDGEDRAAALRRVLRDRAFAAEVERWRVHFAQLFEAWPEAAAPGGLADRIEKSLSPSRPSRGWAWPLVATLATAAAAILLVVVISRPARISPPPPSPPAAAAPLPMLAAAIQPVAKGEAVAVIYDPAQGVIRVAGGVGHPLGRAEQLWLIAGHDAPRSLGLLAADAQRLPVAASVRRMLSSGVTLAISVEPVGGSPTGLPTGPVVATGKLLAV